MRRTLCPMAASVRGPVMGRSTDLHPDQARLQLRKEWQHLLPMKPLRQHPRDSLVDPVSLKYAFRQMQSNRRDRCKRSSSRCGLPIDIAAAGRCGASTSSRCG